MSIKRMVILLIIMALVAVAIAYISLLSVDQIVNYQGNTSR